MFIDGHNLVELIKVDAAVTEFKSCSLLEKEGDIAICADCDFYVSENEVIWHFVSAKQQVIWKNRTEALHVKPLFYNNGEFCLEHESLNLNGGGTCILYEKPIPKERFQDWVKENHNRWLGGAANLLLEQVNLKKRNVV